MVAQGDTKTMSVEFTPGGAAVWEHGGLKNSEGSAVVVAKRGGYPPVAHVRSQEICGRHALIHVGKGDCVISVRVVDNKTSLIRIDRITDVVSKDGKAAVRVKVECLYGAGDWRSAVGEWLHPAVDAAITKAHTPGCNRAMYVAGVPALRKPAWRRETSDPGLKSQFEALKPRVKQLNRSGVDVGRLHLMFDRFNLRSGEATKPYTQETLAELIQILVDAEEEVARRDAEAKSETEAERRRAEVQEADTQHDENVSRIEADKRAYWTKRAKQSCLVFGGFQISSKWTGVYDLADGWVVLPDGSLREPDEGSLDVESLLIWDNFLPDELLLVWHLPQIGREHHFLVLQRPQVVTEEQAARATAIQEEVEAKFRGLRGGVFRSISPASSGWYLSPEQDS